MENELFGEYLGFTKRKFTKIELLQIRQDIIDGVILTDIAAKYQVGDKAIRSIFREFIIIMADAKIEIIKKRLGHKNASYYETEEELLTGIPNYKWEDLDRPEQQFYLNYGKKFKEAQNRREDYALE